MTLEAAAILLIAALRARAASWTPCTVSPGELARAFAGPPPALTGRIMRDPALRDMVLRGVESPGVQMRYDRRERAFVIEAARLSPRA